MKRKFLKPALALALVAAMAVGGSLAYITSQTDEINNKFVMADTNKENTDILDISMKETFTFTDGTGKVTDLSEEETKLATVLPGDKITKDPIISVDKLDLETLKQGAYIFAKITDEQNLMGTFGFVVDTTDAWTAVDAAKYPGVYYILKEEGVTATTALPNIFDETTKTITVTDDFHAGFGAENAQSILVQGYAIQAQGTGDVIMTPENAWKALGI